MKTILENDFFQEEIRCGFKVSERMKHVWAVEIDLMEKLKDVCEKNDLKFFMAGGTLLGAVRHKGFVPWDDDADFLMPREDFERLKKIAPEEFTEPYYFKAEMGTDIVYHGGFARLINQNTTAIVHLDIDNAGESGIWIDISILDSIYEDEKKREKQVRRIRRLQRLVFAKTFSGLKKLTGLSSAEWKLYKLAAARCKSSRLIDRLHETMTECSVSTKAACFTYHHDRYMPIIYNREDYMDTVLLDFESIRLPAPIGYERHLKTQYGDYKEYPAEDKRGVIRAALLDPHIPYDSFLFKFERIAGDLRGKRIVIFGAGQMLEHYLQNEGGTYPPEFIVDNDAKKWGADIRGIPVKAPEEIRSLEQESSVMIICSIYYREIAKQLREMGISRYFIYVQDRSWL